MVGSIFAVEIRHMQDLQGLRTGVMGRRTEFFGPGELIRLSQVKDECNAEGIDGIVNRCGWTSRDMGGLRIWIRDHYVERNALLPSAASRFRSRRMALYFGSLINLGTESFVILSVSLRMQKGEQRTLAISLKTEFCA